MSEPKAQLVDPQENMNLPGMNATGVITASSFSGDGGVVTGLTGGGNLNVGVVTATSFVGDGTGHAAGLTGTPNLNLGLTTATSFIGDATGKAAGLTGTPNLNVGLITATSFVGNVTGDITGNITGNVTGNIVGDVTGNITGLASSIKSGNSLGVGVCTAIQYHGNGANLTGAGSSAYIAQEVTAGPNINSETIIDLSDGNLIYFDQTTTSTTVGFASTSAAEQITFIRDTGPVTPSFATGAVDFDGTGDYLSLAATADFNFGTGDYTVECWIKDDDTSDPGGIWTQYDYYSTLLYKKNDGTLSIYGIIGVGNHAYLINSAAGAITQGKWHHTAVVRSNQILTLYIDGVSVGTYNQTASTPTPSANSPFYIGSSFGDGSHNVFNGQISNLRVVKGTAVYTENFDPPFYDLTNITNTKLLCCQSTSDVTAKAVGGTITSNGDPAAGAQTVTSASTVTPRITWPNTVRWSGGDRTAPTLLSSGAPGAYQIFHLTTGDTGASYQAWEEMQDSPAIYNLWSWGYGGTGNQGQNDRTSRSSPAQVGTDTAWVYVSKNTFGDAGIAGIKNDGTLWTWGFNSDGCLGQNTATTRLSSPTQVGTATNWSNNVQSGSQKVIITKTDGTLWMWGENYYGNLGQNQGGEDNENRSSPTQIPGTTWSTSEGGVSMGQNASYGIKTDGSLWAWGMNEYGQLGQNNKTNKSSPVQVGTDTTWSQISGGGSCASAIKTDGTLWTWGINDDGNLAHNDNDTPTRRSSPKQVGTDTTWYKVHGQGMATKTDGTLWLWGSNFHGTVANNRTSYSSPVQVPGSWDKDLFRLGGGTAAAIKTDGTLWTWGRNYAGNLGLNAPQPSEKSSPTQVGTDTNWKAVGGGGSYTTVALRS